MDDPKVRALVERTEEGIRRCLERRLGSNSRDNIELGIKQHFWDQYGPQCEVTITWLDDGHVYVIAGMGWWDFIAGSMPVLGGDG